MRNVTMQAFYELFPPSTEKMPGIGTARLACQMRAQARFSLIKRSRESFLDWWWL
jgi:hypothetical protein